MPALTFYARRCQAISPYDWIDSEPQLYSIGLCNYRPIPANGERTIHTHLSDYEYLSSNNIFYTMMADNLRVVHYCFTDDKRDNYINMTRYDQQGSLYYWGFRYNGHDYEFATAQGYMGSVGKYILFSDYDLTTQTISCTCAYDSVTHDYTLYGGITIGDVYPSQGSPEYKIQQFKALLNLAPGPDPYGDPYTEGGGSSVIGGGSGNYDSTSDPVSVPSLPTFGASEAGFITLFNPNISDLNDLSRYMWVNPLFDMENWKKIFADPMQAIIGLSIVPVTVSTSGTANVTIGNIRTSVVMPLVDSQYATVDCGSITVNEFWGGYLDYAPYTKVEIYLPYCGIHPLNIDDVMGKTVQVVYHIDILSGGCCVFIKCNDAILYSFAGQCCTNIPMTSENWTRSIHGVLTAAISLGSMVATDGKTAPMALPQFASAVTNDLKPTVERSGALSGSVGLLSYQKPYLIFTRPRQAVPANQNKFLGYPSYITAQISTLSGYTEFESIHLDHIGCTDAELIELENLLKAGVIL